MEELVFLKNDQALADSLMVAEIFEKKHNRVLRAIDNLISSLPKKGTVNETKNGAVKIFIQTRYKDAKGEYRKKYLMNRDGFSLLVMGFTGKKALEWKLKYIEAFNAMEKILKEKQTTEWIETRERGQITRRSETDAIKQLVEYAKGQGSEHAEILYMTYSKLANRTVGVENRETASNTQLFELTAVEKIIAKVVLDGIRDGIPYKDIYRTCKERAETVSAWMKGAE